MHWGELIRPAGKEDAPDRVGYHGGTGRCRAAGDPFELGRRAGLAAALANAPLEMMFLAVVLVHGFRRLLPPY